MTMSQSVDDAIAALFPEEAPMLPEQPAQPWSGNKTCGLPTGWGATENGMECSISAVPAMTIQNPFDELDGQLLTPRAQDDNFGVWVSYNYEAARSEATTSGATCFEVCQPLAPFENTEATAQVVNMEATAFSAVHGEPPATAHETTGSAARATESAHETGSSDEGSARTSPAVGSGAKGSSGTSEASASTGAGGKRKRKEKIRLRAWTEDEHERFVYALDKFRTDKTEAIGPNGERSVGLGPGIAEVIAMMVGTRNAAQVRSHAQKYFKKQRKELANGSR